MRECAVLPARVSDLLVPLRGLIESLDMMTRMPQIEIAVGKRGAELVLAMVFRVLEPASEGDRERLIAFAREHDFELWFQHKGPDTITLEWAPQGESRLAYELPEFGITMPYRPTDFTQVNHGINEVLVSRALRLLETVPGERVADLFCGLGNFTLPIARTAGDVVGIEGSASLVQRALENARRNGVEAHTRFEVRNLFTMTPEAWQALGPFDRVLIDPPREGALEVCKSIALSPQRPKRIVYVSCNPATLARDAGVLVGVGGWTLRAAGVVNMFPNTSHVESIAVFDPPPADFVASLPAAEDLSA
jgi:23S rRNA (uracil1939-C5)-methyltransferase